MRTRPPCKKVRCVEQKQRVVRHVSEKEVVGEKKRRRLQSEAGRW